MPRSATPAQRPPIDPPAIVTAKWGLGHLSQVLSRQRGDSPRDCDLTSRNEETTLITRFQAIEYATAITVGKQVADAFGIMRLGHGGGRRCRFSHEIAKAWMGLAF